MTASITDYGVFGDAILLEYCGSNVVSQFFDSQHSNAMLLTEKQMGKLAVQNVAEFMAFTSISIIIQTVFVVYFKAIKSHSNQDCHRTQCVAMCLRVLVLLWCALASCVLVHVFIEMYHYYDFVNISVVFDVDYINELRNDYENDNNAIDAEFCDEQGIGQLACPSFLDVDAHDSGVYSPENTKAICSWLFWLLISSNPKIFQFMILTSFICVDAGLYAMIVTMTGCAPTLLCDCCSWFCCWFCCANSEWTPPRGCPMSIWCCDVGDQSNLCYCCCGIFGPIFWFIDICLTIILMMVICAGLCFAFCVMGAIFGALSMIVIFIFAFPSGYASINALLAVTTGDIQRFVASDNYVHGLSIRAPIHNPFKKPRRMPYITSMIAMFCGPLWSISMIALTQVLLSIFLLYYVVEGSVLFWPWQYFAPIFVGLYEWIISIGTAKSGDIANIVVSSLSWSSLLDANASADFEAFKYSVLLLRTALHILIGISQVMTHDDDDEDDGSSTKRSAAGSQRHPTSTESYVPETHDAPVSEIVSLKVMDTDISSECPWKHGVRISKILFETLDSSLFDPRGDLCYCAECHSERGDDLIYTRGDPPKKYALPIGWLRFGLKTEKSDVWNQWHVAYHGTKKDNIPKIFESKLRLLKPGDSAADGESIAIRDGHIKEPFSRLNKYTQEEEWFDPIQIYCSPSVKYSGHAAYAEVFEITDRDKVYRVQVAFQLRIKPGTYNIGQQTVGATETMDKHFENNELEWYTKQNEYIVLTGLLFRVQDT